jgi:hypothetical protein
VRSLTTEDKKKMNNIALRDWFAGQALAGLLASGHFTQTGGYLVVLGNREYSAPSAAWVCAKQMMKVHDALTACEKAQQKKLKGRAAK